MEDEKIINGNCWVACFDILGFRVLMRQNEKDLDGFVRIYYEAILEEMDRKVKYWPRHVASFWASDTFVFYTFSDSFEAFTCINQVARHFFTQVLSMMPMRGALSFGHLYANRKKGMYLGPVLIDAYEYAEKQDWVGFVLTPCAIEQLSKGDISEYLAYESDYKKCEVPVKLKESLGDEPLYAFKFFKYPSKVRKIQEWSHLAEKKDHNIARKYQNTLNFIEKK